VQSRTILTTWTVATAADSKKTIDNGGEIVLGGLSMIRSGTPTPMSWKKLEGVALDAGLAASQLGRRRILKTPRLPQ